MINATLFILQSIQLLKIRLNLKVTFTFNYKKLTLNI